MDPTNKSWFTIWMVTDSLFNARTFSWWMVKAVSLRLLSSMSVEDNSKLDEVPIQKRRWACSLELSTCGRGRERCYPSSARWLFIIYRRGWRNLFTPFDVWRLNCLMGCLGCVCLLHLKSWGFFNSYFNYHWFVSWIIYLVYFMVFNIYMLAIMGLEGKVRYKSF